MESITRELKKLAFFLQHSGLFDKFPPRTRNVLEELPIEWESAETGGETILEWQKDPTWETADLKGKLKDKPIEMKIKRTSDRYVYTIIYDGHKSAVSSLEQLKSIINSYVDGAVPKPKILQTAYNLLQQKKEDIYVGITKYLEGITDLHWEFEVRKDIGRVYARFYVDLGEDDEDKEVIMRKLKEHNYYRIDCVGSYLKMFLKKEGIELAEEKHVKRKFINLGHQAGFIITLYFK